MMSSKRTFLRIILQALLVIAALGVLRCSSPKVGSREPVDASRQPAAQSGGEEKQAANEGVAETPKSESELVVGKPVLSQGNILRFPINFTSGRGDSVGVIHAQVSIPKGPWKFLKAEPPFKSHLKVSAKQAHQDNGGKGETEAGQKAIDLVISGGGDAIDDGIAAYLDFLGPEAESARTELPVARILKTVPVQTKSPTDLSAPDASAPSAPSEGPYIPSPPVPVNPGMGCFFFTH